MIVKATFSDCKLIKTRSVFVCSFEIPIEQADAALAALGGVPQPASERWVEIALLDQKEAPKPSEVEYVEDAGPVKYFNAGDGSLPSANPQRQRRPFSELSLAAQAGVRSNDKEFWAWITATHNFGVGSPAFCAEWIRQTCGVTSRADLDKQLIAGKKWRELEAEFQAWRLTQRYSDTIR